MAGTKIINVQKNDSFEEVFDTLSTTDAKEVIFIFPRGTIFGRNGEYFQSIKAEAEKGAKLVNVMSADPVIVQLAKSYGFGVLQNPAPRKRPAPIKNEVVNDIVPGFAPDPETYYADLALARKKAPIPDQPEESGRKIKDIVTAQDDHELEVKDSIEKEEHIEISRSPLIPTASSPQITNNIPEIVNQQTGVNDIEKLWEEEERRRNPDAIVDNKTKRSLFGSISKKFILIPLAAALVVLGIILYSTLGNAKVVVRPRTQDIDFKLKVTVAVNTETVQPEFSKIPGQQFSINKEATGSYPSTSQQEVAQKASGKIKIYNSSKESQRLVATTRFSTKEGLIFRIPDTITVPASSSIESSVYADRTGKEYNIAPTRFTIPGFDGTPRATLFYATSVAPMTGGMVGMAKVVAEQDFLKAKEELTAKAKEEVLIALKEQLGDLKTFEPVEVVIDAPSVNAKVGEAADSLEMKVRASVVIIAYRMSDLEELIQAYISKTGNLDLIKKDMDLSFKLLSNNIKEKSIQFEVNVKGRAAAHVDLEKVLKDIQGKDEKGIKIYFESLKEVESANIRLSPFWLTKVPRDAKKIQLSIDIS